MKLELACQIILAAVGIAIMVAIASFFTGCTAFRAYMIWSEKDPVEIPPPYRTLE